MGGAQEIHPLRTVGNHETAGQMQPAGLAGDFLKLFVKPDGIGLQLCHIGIAVQRVKPTGGMPGGA